MSDAANQIIRDAMRSASVNAFEAAIALCEALESEGGHTPACCAKAIRDFRAKVYPTPELRLVG